MSSRRRTAHGQRIAELLASVPDFKTAQDVYELLRADGTKIGLATVYRQLQTLAEDGDVDVIRLADGQAAYRLCSDGHHHHLICRECHRTEEFSDSELEPILTRIARQHQFSLVAHDLELSGICGECRP